MLAQQLINESIKPTLFFSGGKDSLACLLLLRPFWGQITVAWANPGSPHPETVAYMRRIAAMVPNFVELTGSQPLWIQRHGWPVDVVPVRSSIAGEIGAGIADVKFQSYTDCCWSNMWRPMLEHVKSSGSTLVIMGQRKDEALRNRLRDGVAQVIDGVCYFQPINEWSEADVFEYIQSQGHELPPFYSQGATSSSDCWNCTAYLDHSKGRLANMRTSDPEKFAVIEKVLTSLATTLQRESAPLFEILGEHHG